MDRFPRTGIPLNMTSMNLSFDGETHCVTLSEWQLIGLLTQFYRYYGPSAQSKYKINNAAIDFTRIIPYLDVDSKSPDPDSFRQYEQGQQMALQFVTTLTQLPDDVLDTIMGYVDFATLHKLSQVNTMFNARISEDDITKSLEHSHTRVELRSAMYYEEGYQALKKMFSHPLYITGDHIIYYVLKEDTKIIDGPCRVFFNNGKLNISVTLVRNKLDGRAEMYDRWGNPRFKADFDVGVPIGRYTRFMDQGKPWIKEFYKQGLLSGARLVYDGNGRVITKSIYKQGVLDGPYEAEHGPEGCYHFFSERGLYKQGEKEGRWIYYFFNGNVDVSGNYASSKAEGIWITCFHNRFQPDTSSGLYVDGVKEGPWVEYCDEHKRPLAGKGDYKKNKRVGLWEFYDLRSKTLFARGNYSNGEKSGDWNYYDHEGELDYTRHH